MLTHDSRHSCTIRSHVRSYQEDGAGDSFLEDMVGATPSEPDLASSYEKGLDGIIDNNQIIMNSS